MASLCLELLPESSSLRAFHDADRATLAQVYASYHDVVYDAARRILSPSEAENVTHDVFYRMLSDRDFRLNFAGGHLRAWLTRVATNQAIDVRRRRLREESVDPAELASSVEDSVAARAENSEEEREAALLVERFRAELPEKWSGVFEVRFVRQLPQRQAAKELGMHRTTLVYYETRVRAMLRRFLLRAEWGK